MLTTHFRPLCTAVMNGGAEVVELLLAAYRTDVPLDQGTLALAVGRPNILEKLLAHNQLWSSDTLREAFTVRVLNASSPNKPVILSTHFS